MRITTWAEYGVICALNLAKRTDLGPVNGREMRDRNAFRPTTWSRFSSG